MDVDYVVPQEFPDLTGGFNEDENNVYHRLTGAAESNARVNYTAQEPQVFEAIGCDDLVAFESDGEQLLGRLRGSELLDIAVVNPK